MPDVADPALPAAFGKYELLEQIGLGGMAVIYKARVTSTDGFERIIAIKKILPELARQRAFIQMLIAEAKVTSLLNHPNIVPIYELGEIGGRYYIAMEYVDGADLLEILSRCAGARLRVPTETALYLISEVCKGLAHAHAATSADGRPLQIIHRDVSPSNILVSRTGAVKIMDFGVAHADLKLSKSLELQHQSLKGKLGYMSPEQISGEPIDRRSDVFALGVILFECLSLKRLFVGKTDAQTILNVREADIEKRFRRHGYIPRPVRDILRRALARDPDDRYQTATDFQEALLDYLFESRLRVSPRQVASFLHQIEAATNPQRPTAAAPGPAPPPNVDDDDDGPRPPPALPDLPPEAAAAAAAPATLRRVDLSRATFFFRNDHEETFGPLDFRQVHGLLTHRCVGPLEWISINGSDWLRARDVQAVVDLFPALFEDEPAPPLYDGPLNRLRTPHVFHTLHATRLTGKLKLLRGTVQKSIYFDNGQPTTIHSNIKSELLGAYLIHRGHTTAAQIEEALADPEATTLGAILHDKGFLSSDALAHALEGQFVERLLEPFTWEAGWYEVFPGEVPDVAPPTPTIPPLPELTMRGLRTHYPLVALDAIFHDYLDNPIVLSHTPASTADRFALSPREQECFSTLRPDATLRTVLEGAEGARQIRGDLLRVAFALYQTDQLAFRAAPRSAA